MQCAGGCQLRDCALSLGVCDPLTCVLRERRVCGVQPSMCLSVRPHSAGGLSKVGHTRHTHQAKMMAMQLRQHCVSSVRQAHTPQAPWRALCGTRIVYSVCLWCVLQEALGRRDAIRCKQRALRRDLW
jgi:hypothetical protein